MPERLSGSKLYKPASFGPVTPAPLQTPPVVPKAPPPNVVKCVVMSVITSVSQIVTAPSVPSTTSSTIVI